MDDALAGSPPRIGRLAWLAALLIWGAGAFAQPVPVPVVKACGHHDYPPWNWLKNGEIVGTCADMTRRAIERLGYKVDLRFVGPWKRCQRLVETGDVDVNICAFRNAEREASSVVVEPRMGQNRIVLFVRERPEPLRFKGWDDLKGLRTGLIAGVSMGPEFDGFLDNNTKVERASSLMSVFKMLELDRVDIAPFGLEAGLLAIEHHGFKGRLVPLERPALVGDLYVFVSKKSPLAAQAAEIGKYFERPAYREELQNSLAEHGRLYLEAAR